MKYYVSACNRENDGTSSTRGTLRKWGAQERRDIRRLISARSVGYWVPILEKHYIIALREASSVGPNATLCRDGTRDDHVKAVYSEVGFKGPHQS